MDDFTFRSSQVDPSIIDEPFLDSRPFPPLNFDDEEGDSDWRWDVLSVLIGACAALVVGLALWGDRIIGAML